MKSIREIQQWMRDRKCYGKCLNEIERSKRIDPRWGERRMWTEEMFLYAFDWSRSLDGDRFWNGIHRDFEDWYD